jgi:hypothetical protein
VNFSEFLKEQIEGLDLLLDCGKMLEGCKALCLFFFINLVKSGGVDLDGGAGGVSIRVEKGPRPTPQGT